MSLYGPRSGGTFADDAGIGTVAWSNPSRVIAPDGQFATASLNKGLISHYLKVTNFGFNVPTGSLVTGIRVTILRNGPAGQDLRDGAIKIVQGGVIGGLDHATQNGWVMPVAQYQSYGGPTDLWGLAWTPADINASGFGVAISARDVVDDGAATASIDHVQITVAVNFGLQGDYRTGVWRGGGGLSFS